MDQINIDKSLKIPLHHQIYTDLLDKINNRQYKVRIKCLQSLSCNGFMM